MIVVRFPLATPDVRSYTHNEVQPAIQINLSPLTADAPLGEITGYVSPVVLPADPSQPATERRRSVPFRLIVDQEALAVILGQMERLARAQRVAGMDSTSAPPVVSV